MAVDTTTGEVADEPDQFARLLARLADTPDTDLVTVGRFFEEQAQKHSDMVGKIKAEIARRMAAVDATAMYGTGCSAVVDRSRSYIWDIPALYEKLRPLLPTAVFDECVEELPPPPPPVKMFKANTVKLLALRKKLGSQVGAVLDECHRVEEGNPRVSFKTT